MKNRGTQSLARRVEDQLHKAGSRLYNNGDTIVGRECFRVAQEVHEALGTHRPPRVNTVAPDGGGGGPGSQWLAAQHLAEHDAQGENRPMTVRAAARHHHPLDGADAQALEGALQQVERELLETREELAVLKSARRRAEDQVEQFSGELQELSVFLSKRLSGEVGPGQRSVHEAIRVIEVLQDSLREAREQVESTTVSLHQMQDGKIEMERRAHAAEARAEEAGKEIRHWKANHDHQVALKRKLRDRYEQLRRTSALPVTLLLTAGAEFRRLHNRSFAGVCERAAQRLLEVRDGKTQSHALDALLGGFSDVVTEKVHHQRDTHGYPRWDQLSNRPMMLEQLLTNVIVLCDALKNLSGCGAPGKRIEAEEAPGEDGQPATSYPQGVDSPDGDTPRGTS